MCYLEQPSYITQNSPPSFPPFSRRTFFRMRSTKTFPGFCPIYITCLRHIVFAIDPFTRDTGATHAHGAEEPPAPKRTIPPRPFRSMRGGLDVHVLTALWRGWPRNTSGKEPLGHKSSVYALVFQASADRPRPLGDAVVLERAYSATAPDGTVSGYQSERSTSRRTASELVLRNSVALESPTKQSLFSAYVCSAKISNFSDKGWWESSMRACFVGGRMIPQTGRGSRICASRWRCSGVAWQLGRILLRPGELRFGREGMLPTGS